MVTIRECARAQGFPDHYVFKSPSTAGSKIYDDVSVYIIAEPILPLLSLYSKFDKLVTRYLYHLRLRLGKNLALRWSRHGKENEKETIRRNRNRMAVGIRDR